MNEPYIYIPTPDEAINIGVQNRIGYLVFLQLPKAYKGARLPQICTMHRNSLCAMLDLFARWSLSIKPKAEMRINQWSVDYLDSENNQRPTRIIENDFRLHAQMGGDVVRRIVAGEVKTYAGACRLITAARKADRNPCPQRT